MVRILVVFLVLLAMIVAFNPASREQVGEAWDRAQPVVIEMMDGMYAALRTLIAGNGADDRIDNHPGAPGVNFDRIVTMNQVLPV